MAQKESERFREFAEKFVLARAPDGPEGVWQAVLDAKTAFKQVIQATEEYAKPEREAQQRIHEQQKKFMEMGRYAREQQMIAENKMDRDQYASGGVVNTQPEDKTSWLNDYVSRSKLSQFLQMPGTAKMKLPDPSSRKL